MIKKLVNSRVQSQLKGIVALFLAIAFPACEEVIDIELKESNPSLTVEGLLTDEEEPYQVKLTTTKDYFSPESSPVVSNALVYISDDAGNIDTLYYTSSGIYKTNQLKKGVVGRTYTLHIWYEGKEYTATSEMKAPLILDSINYTYKNGEGIFEKAYYMTIYAQENGNTVDYYRILSYRNNTLVAEPFKYLLINDEFTQGKYLNPTLPYAYQTGDKVEIVSMSVTKAYYDYFNALSTQVTQTGTPFDPPPANPPTNISNGGLGFWGVASINRKEIIIK